MAASHGQPGWLHWWFQLWHRIIAQSPNTFGYTTALPETLIAVGMIFGLARSSTYILGFIPASASGVSRKGSAARRCGSDNSKWN
jgi:hypothetical protein